MTNTGFKQAAAFGRETLYGSAAVISRPFGLVQSVTPTENSNVIQIRTLGGNRDFQTVMAGKLEISGGIEYYMQDGRFLRYAFGEDTASTGTINSGPKYVYSALSTATGTSYWHTLGSATSPDSNTFPSFSLEFADDEDTAANRFRRTFTGCMVDSMTINSDVDSPITVSCDWIAQNVIATTGSKTSVTQSTKDPYIFYQGALYLTAANNFAGSVALPTSAQVAELTGFSLTLNNNLEQVWYISGTTNVNQSARGIKALVPKGRDYDATLNMTFSDWDQYRRFLGSVSMTGNAVTPQTSPTKYHAVVDFVRGGEGFGYGATTSTDVDMMRIILRSMLFTDINIDGSPEDLVSQDITVSPVGITCHVWDDIQGSYA